jgi:hypothetical protein
MLEGLMRLVASTHRHHHHGHTSRVAVLCAI